MNAETIKGIVESSFFIEKIEDMVQTTDNSKVSLIKYSEKENYNCLVFEDFKDLTAYLTMVGRAEETQFLGDKDYLVLNSLDSIRQAFQVRNDYLPIIKHTAGI